MTVDETLERLKELYYRTTQATIEDAFDEAIDLLKTLPSDDERERAAVYMEGLAEMRHEWKTANRRAQGPPTHGRPKGPPTPGRPKGPSTHGRPTGPPKPKPRP